MVLIDATSSASSNCIVVTGAGSDDANGVYVPTGKKWHDAVVYENDAKCLLSREPHKNQKTGEASYGWIIGQDRKPLYAVQSPETRPPTSGWRKFTGALPLPQLEGPCSFADGATTVAGAFKDNGKTLFTANRYSEAEAKWTRALSLAGQKDGALKVALYSNRSEARLRLSKYDAALSDAQEALRLKPTHDKALLRAAVATRELQMYGESYDFVQKCLEINPRHMEAKVILADLEYIIQDLQSAQPDMAKVARQKMEESIKLQEVERRGKKLGPRDENLLSGVKAFQGYGDARESLAEKDDGRPPLSTLPYHHVGLPGDQVQTMDRFFQEQRDKKDKEKLKAKIEKDNYQKVKKEFKARAEEDVREGRLAGLDEIMQRPSLAIPDLAKPPPQPQSLALPSAKAKTEPMEKATLSAYEMAEIDELFAGLPTRSSSQSIEKAPEPSEKQKRLEKARAALMG